MFTESNNQGFTLIELVIVFVLIGILVLISLPFFSNSTRRSELKNRTFELVDTLRRAQTQSFLGKGNSTWGIHFEASQYTYFKGASYNPVDPQNEVTVLPTNIVISLISLNGGGADIIFNKVYGDTSQYGTIQLQETPTSETRTITINQVGMVDHTSP